MESKDSIITLQLGHYSNYVGAHFWNIQEAGFVYPGEEESVTSLEVNHGVLFREGRTTRTNEVTFTPRLVSVDLKNALGSLPVFGDLYDDKVKFSDDDVAWGGDVIVAKEEGREKNEYQRHLEMEEEQEWAKLKHANSRGDNGSHERAKKKRKGSLKQLYNLDSQVRVWSDFLRTRYHPKTNVVIPDYQHDDLTINPFDVYGLGYHRNSTDPVLEDVEDRIRFFAEESDCLRGFHLLSDSCTGFGGLAVKVSEILAEDYGSKAVLTFPVTPSQPDMTEAMKKAGVVPAIHCMTMFLNSALTVHGLSQSTALTTPMSVLKDTFPLLKTGSDHVRSLPLVNYQPQFPYHSSAILASALDVLTLPWRSYNVTGAPAASLASELNRGGRRLASVAIRQPLPVKELDSCFVRLLEELEASGDSLNSLTTSLTPGCNDVENGIDMQMVSLRGIDQSVFRTGARSSYKGKYAMIDGVDQALMAHYDSKVLTRSVFTANAALPVGCPFPQIFDGKKLSRTGLQTSKNESECVDSVSAMTLWQSSEKGIGQTISKMADRAAKVNLNKLPKFLQAGLEHDALGQAVEELTELGECYTDTCY